MLPKCLGTLIGGVVGDFIGRLPPPWRGRVARLVARVVSRMPGGGWAAVMITSDDYEC